MWTERDTVVGSETLIQVKSIEVCWRCFFLLDKHIVPWQLSTSKLLSPLWAQWGGADLNSTFLHLQMHQEVLGCSTGRNVSLCMNCAEHDKIPFLSLFPSVFHCHHLIHSVFVCILSWLQVFVWDQSTQLFIVYQTLLLFLCLCQSVPNQSELNEEHHFTWMC